MTWLEWVGAVSMVCLMPLGFLVVFMYFLEAWANQKHIRKAVLGYYYEKLKREYQKRKRGTGA